MREPSLRDRLTVRVLLLDPDDRLLLMKGKVAFPDPVSAWFTVGGGAEPGETVLQAAVREVREETGFADVDFGPVIWLCDGPLTLPSGERVMMREHYLVARCPGGEPSRDGWDEVERKFVEDLRWWSLDEIAASREIIFPTGLAAMLPDVLAGRHPNPPIAIAWDTPPA
jgi:ADP-ribose pyrophosphatase YjhB (NUDIX family)